MSSKYLGETFDIHGGGMDLLFPHHESEIAQSTIAHGHPPVRYWMHNNMITINGKKMGKSYNNVIKITELFSGNHPMLEQAYHPMVVRFYILQTHYRSPLDFSNEALQGSEKGLRRLWEAYEVLKKLVHSGNTGASDKSLDTQVIKWCNECEEFMNDDFSTAKVLANLFELAPVINGIKGGQIKTDAISADTFALLNKTFKNYLEDIFGLQPLQAQQSNKIDEVLSLVIEMRKDARARKDFATSDQIRNKLAEAGITLKDEKDGTVSYTIE
jgi:cysteinyl-tRNA synthetase